MNVRMWGVALVLGLAAPALVEAQAFPNFGGVGVRVGAVSPEAASTGFGWTIDLDLGYWGRPRLRTLLALNGFSADVERRVGGTTTGGSYDATAGRAGVRWDVLGTGRFTPYVGAAIVAMSVDAKVSDAGTRDLLDGFYVGAAGSGGLTFALDSLGRFALTGEARRVFVTNVSHWALEIGVRWMPRGPGSYVGDARRARAR
jgi:hypothetical protein